MKTLKKKKKDLEKAIDVHFKIKNKALQTMQKLLTPYKFFIQPWKETTHLFPQGNPWLISDALWWQGKKIKLKIHFSFKNWLKQDPTSMWLSGRASPSIDHLTISCLCQALADNTSHYPIRALQLSHCI